jgi:hypothetical protein
MKVIVFFVFYTLNPIYLDYHIANKIDFAKLNQYRDLPQCDKRRFRELYNIIQKDSLMTITQINFSSDSIKKINDSLYYLYSKKYLFAITHDQCK